MARSLSHTGNAAVALKTMARHGHDYGRLRGHNTKCRGSGLAGSASLPPKIPIYYSFPEIIEYIDANTPIKEKSVEVIVKSSCSNNAVDPDPFVIASISMAAAALVLQFLQTWKAFSSDLPADQIRPNPNEINQLSHLEESLDKVQSSLRQIHRLVERGSQSSEKEFYEAPYRVGTTELLLDSANHMHVQQQLAMGFTNIGGLANWVNHIIGHNQKLAARLGQRIAGGLEGTADALNAAMASGAPNRVVVGEARQALQALQAAIEAELSDGN